MGKKTMELYTIIIARINTQELKRKKQEGRLLLRNYRKIIQIINDEIVELVTNLAEKRGRIRKVEALKTNFQD